MVHVPSDPDERYVNPEASLHPQLCNSNSQLSPKAVDELLTCLIMATY